MATLFSVIVPSFNRAAMLRSALKTVRWQTLEDWECFVVDDGSTDDTPRVCAEFASDPRFRILRSDRNQGMNASRNLALERCAGTFVTFLDSDDLWLPERLAAFLDRAQASPKAGFVFSNAWVLRFGRITGPLFDPDRHIPEGRVPGYYAIGERWLPYVTTNVAILREAFVRHGKFRTEMRTLDTELYARFLAGGLEVAAIRRPLSVRRLHGEQLTDRYVENFEESMQAVAAAGTGPEETARLRAAVAVEVALYLVKAARPAEARAFLESKLGPAAAGTPAWRLASAPAWSLRLAKSLRASYLRLRHHPCLAPPEERAALDLVEPLLEDEALHR